jgi:hypothetical protein
VEDFSLRLTTVVSQLRVLDDEVSDKEMIKKLMHVVPDNLEQVAISMEALLDLKSLSIEEVVGHLCTVELRKKPSPSKEAEGRLLLRGVDGKDEDVRQLRLQCWRPQRWQQQRWWQKQGKQAGHGRRKEKLCGPRQCLWLL